MIVCFIVSFEFIIMNKIKMFLGRLGRLWYMKYVIVVVLGVLFVGFLDDNSLWAHMRNKQHIDELSSEIEQYRESYNSNLTQIEELKHNPKAIEKIARERYFMKADDEDIFVLSDDGEDPDKKADGDETVK